MMRYLSIILCGYFILTTGGCSNPFSNAKKSGSNPAPEQQVTPCEAGQAYNENSNACEKDQGGQSSPDAPAPTCEPGTVFNQASQVCEKASVDAGPDIMLPTDLVTTHGGKLSGKLIYKSVDEPGDYVAYELNEQDLLAKKLSTAKLSLPKKGKFYVGLELFADGIKVAATYLVPGAYGACTIQAYDREDQNPITPPLCVVERRFFQIAKRCSDTEKQSLVEKEFWRAFCGRRSDGQPETCSDKVFYFAKNGDFLDLNFTNELFSLEPLKLFTGLRRITLTTPKTYDVAKGRVSLAPLFDQQELENVLLYNDVYELPEAGKVLNRVVSLTITHVSATTIAMIPLIFPKLAHLDLSGPALDNDNATTLLHLNDLTYLRLSSDMLNVFNSPLTHHAALRRLDLQDSSVRSKNSVKAPLVAGGQVLIRGEGECLAGEIFCESENEDLLALQGYWRGRFKITGNLWIEYNFKDDQGNAYDNDALIKAIETKRRLINSEVTVYEIEVKDHKIGIKPTYQSCEKKVDEFHATIEVNPYMMTLNNAVFFSDLDDHFFGYNRTKKIIDEGIAGIVPGCVNNGVFIEDDKLPQQYQKAVTLF